MDDFDARVGANLKAVRQRAGKTQAELAEMLTEAGYPMHQQTILKIESGSRPLRLSEATVIAEKLSVPLSLLAEIGSMYRVRDALSQLQSIHTAVVGSIRQHVHAAFELEQAVRLAKSGPDVNGVAAGTLVLAEGDLGRLTVASAIAAVVGWDPGTLDTFIQELERLKRGDDGEHPEASER